MAHARHILVGGSIAVLVAAGSTRAGAAAEPAPSPQPVVHILAVVHDLDVRGDVLSQAKREVSQIYGLSGVTIVWDSAKAEDTEEARAQRLFVVFKPVRNDPATAALKRSVMGAAITSLAHGGRLAYIFYGRLLAPGHSDRGIMRADWTKDDVIRASRGALRFTPDQAAKLRRAATRQGLE
jgi:hypothetical protein